MTNIFQTGSRLALIAALAGVPAAVTAQTATTDTTAKAEVTTDTEAAKDDMKDAADKAGDAVEKAADKTGDAMEKAADKTGDAMDKAADKADKAADKAAAETEKAADKMGDAVEGAAEATDETAEKAAAEAEAAVNATSQEEVVKPVEGQIVLQSENTILANDLIGSAVYSSEGESIGDINDMIVNLDGTVDGVVIGVGGFLGIGEKDVAIEMNSLSTVTDEDGNIRLITSATQADLEAAEAFVTKAAQDQSKRAMDAMPAGDGTAPVAPASGN